MNIRKVISERESLVRELDRVESEEKMAEIQAKIDALTIQIRAYQPG